MTRQEFSRMISDKRKEKGISIKNVCDVMNFTTSGYSAINTARHNYNMKLCLDYISASGASLIFNVWKDDKKTKILNYEQLVTYLIDRRKQMGFSTYYMGKAMNSSGSMVRHMENFSSTVSIDMLLKMCEVLELRLELS